MFLLILLFMINMQWGSLKFVDTSHTEEEHWKHICMVFNKLAQYKYYVKHKKCKLFSTKVEFLGYTVLAAGVGIV